MKKKLVLLLVIVGMIMGVGFVGCSEPNNMENDIVSISVRFIGDSQSFVRSKSPLTKIAVGLCDHEKKLLNISDDSVISVYGLSTLEEVENRSGNNHNDLSLAVEKIDFALMDSLRDQLNSAIDPRYLEFDWMIISPFDGIEKDCLSDGNGKTDDGEVKDPNDPNIKVGDAIDINNDGKPDGVFVGKTDDGEVIVDSDPSSDGCYTLIDNNGDQWVDVNDDGVYGSSGDIHLDTEGVIHIKHGSTWVEASDSEGNIKVTFENGVVDIITGEGVEIIVIPPKHNGNRKNCDYDGKVEKNRGQNRGQVFIPKGSKSPDTRKIPGRVRIK